MHLSIKPSVKFITKREHSSRSGSESYLSRTEEFQDKTLEMHVAEETFVMTIDKVQETKLRKYKS